MAWAEVGSGSQRATKSEITEITSTLAFPGNVTKNSLLVVLGTMTKSLSSDADVTALVTDSLGTTYTVLSATIDGFFSYKFRNFLAYGFAPSSGANTVSVTTSGGGDSNRSFSIDEFSGIQRIDPVYATAEALDVTLTLGGVTLAWTVPAGVHKQCLAAAFIPRLGGELLIVGTVRYVQGPTTITPDSPAIEIGEEESALSTDATHGAAYTSGVEVSSNPVLYEDPCAIEDPRLFTVITTEDETLKFGIHPLRDTAALGGYAEPRLVDVGDIVRQASDPATGTWPAQRATTRFADTDRENRARSSARFGFRGCTQEIYLTGTAQRLAGLPPRVLFAGIINSDSADENLVWSNEINDLIGTHYSLFSEEKQIPQRQVGLSHFPNAAKDVLGLGEPIVGGRLAPLSATDGEGILDTLTLGRITLGGTPGTPTGTTLATVVSALQSSVTGGTTYADWGSRIGYADALALEALGTVPPDYDDLAQVIGYADLDALLAEESTTGGTEYVAVLVAGHAISEILTGLNSDPSVWIDALQLDPAELGTQWWAPQIPGDTTWASEFSADQFTDILGTDGTTRRYTLILFAPGSTYGDLVEASGRVHLDCIGLEDGGDGTGAPIYDAFELYRHLLVNFILQSYLTGDWLDVPTFLFSDGVTEIDRVDLGSFDTAAEIADLQSTGGRIGRLKIGDRASVRDILARCNLSWGCLLGQDDYGQLFVRILDTRRTEFLTGRFTTDEHRTLRDKNDFLPNFRVEGKPDWQVNQLFYEYAPRYYQGDLERPSGGGGVAPVEDTASQATDGILTKTIQLPYVQDDRTATVVAQYYVDLFGKLPRVVTYSRRGVCGLQDDVCDGVPMTHFNGFGESGWLDHAVWVLSKTFHPKQMYCSFTALDVDHLLDVEEAVVTLTSDPVAVETLVSDDGSGDELIAD